MSFLRLKNIVENYLAIVQELLAKNANPDATKEIPSRYYNTSQRRYIDFTVTSAPPIAHAVWNNNIEMVKTLMKAGAKEGSMYFFDALEKEDLEIARLIYTPIWDISENLGGMVKGRQDYNCAASSR